MKRALLAIIVLGVASVLGGCPVYSNSGNYRVCNSSGCFDCPDPGYSGMCIPWTCNTDADCGSGYACSGGGECVAGGGSPAAPSDCGSSPCPNGTVCKLAGGTAQCVPNPGEEDAAFSCDEGGCPPPESDGGPYVSEAGEWVDSSVDAGGPLTDTGVVMADASEASAPSFPCNANGDCALGDTCIDGQCVPQGNLCSDGTQCVVTGESCVNGICLPTCNAAAPCPTGYDCNLTLKVCSVNPAPCVGSGASSCQGGAVCVESHCVPPCSSTGAQACPSGQLCVNGGCIPDQRAQFDCKNDGKSGVLANDCDNSSICLHHDCYPACDLDGGGCSGSAPCKQVTVIAGTYAVCAAPSTLGSECDPAAGAECTGGASCVDGYCQ